MAKLVTNGPTRRLTRRRTNASDGLMRSDDSGSFATSLRLGVQTAAAVVLVHLFATPPIGFVDLMLHAVFVAVSFSIAFSLSLFTVDRLIRPASLAARLWLASIAAVGTHLLLTASVGHLHPPLPQAVLHELPAGWLPRLLLVWGIVTALLVQAERNRQLAADLASLNEIGPSPGSRPRIVLFRDGSHRRSIDISSISHISANENYCAFHFADGAHLLLRTTLQEALSSLPDGFAQTHRSHVVNLALIEAVRPAGRAFEISIGGATIPVSRSQIRHVVDCRQRTLGAR